MRNSDARSKPQTSRVSIARNADPCRAVKEALDLLGGMGRIIRRNDKVLIKPNNLIAQYVPGTVTSKEVIAALASSVKIAGKIKGKNPSARARLDPLRLHLMQKETR